MIRLFVSAGMVGIFNLLTSSYDFPMAGHGWEIVNKVDFKI